MQKCTIELILENLQRFVCSRPEMVVGWYHSHPGFGCWLSGVDINTQQSFEALSERAVAVVVDPIQSVKGKVMVHTDIHIKIPYLDITQSCKCHQPQQGDCNLILDYLAWSHLALPYRHLSCLFMASFVVSFLLIPSHIVSYPPIFFTFLYM